MISGGLAFQQSRPDVNVRLIALAANAADAAYLTFDRLNKTSSRTNIAFWAADFLDIRHVMAPSRFVSSSGAYAVPAENPWPDFSPQVSWLRAGD